MSETPNFLVWQPVALIVASDGQGKYIGFHVYSNVCRFSNLILLTLSSAQLIIIILGDFRLGRCPNRLTDRYQKYNPQA